MYTTNLADYVDKTISPFLTHFDKVQQNFGGWFESKDYKKCIKLIQFFHTSNISKPRKLLKVILTTFLSFLVEVVDMFIYSIKPGAMLHDASKDFEVKNWC